MQKMKLKNKVLGYIKSRRSHLFGRNFSTQKRKTKPQKLTPQISQNSLWNHRRVECTDTSRIRGKVRSEVEHGISSTQFGFPRQI